MQAGRDWAGFGGRRAEPPRAAPSAPLPLPLSLSLPPPPPLPLPAVRQNLSYAPRPVLWVESGAPPPPPPPPPPVPARPRAKRGSPGGSGSGSGRSGGGGGGGSCPGLALWTLALLALLALAGAGLGLFQIVQLQKELAELREATSPGHLPPAAEKHTGLPNATEKIVEKKEVRKAVHLTGKSGQKGLPLEWEAIYGHAFTSSIQYKQGSLMINETGLYFVYSSVFFRGEFCNNQPLDHTVYKRNPGYLGNQVLMEDRRMNYCATQKMWAGNSYLGALFNLTRMDRLYVNVSKIALVHFEESKTFFGVFKL